MVEHEEDGNTRNRIIKIYSCYSEESSEIQAGVEVKVKVNIT
jgi:hypothetical protein